MEWTQVLIALIAALPGILTVVFTFLIRRAIKTPSGDSLGKVAERTHDLTAADVMLSTAIHRRVVNGDTNRDPQSRTRAGEHN